MRLETHAIGRLLHLLRTDARITQAEIGEAERELGKITDYVHRLESTVDKIKQELDPEWVDN